MSLIPALHAGTGESRDLRSTKLEGRSGPEEGWLTTA